MSEDENFFARWSRRKRSKATETQEHASAAPALQRHAESRLGEGTAFATDSVDDPCGRGLGRGLAETTASLATPTTTLSPQAGGEATESAAPSASPRPDRAQSLDLSKLPPIESITAETDIRGFLAPGVPVEWTRAALRRAWTADPKIRDFIGPSENSWDFNAPDAMGGFGPLEMTDALRRQLLQMVVGRHEAPDKADSPMAPVAQPAPDRARDLAIVTHPAAENEGQQEIAGEEETLLSPARAQPEMSQDEIDPRPAGGRSHGGALPK